jgi:hypothetical protein
MLKIGKIFHLHKIRLESYVRKLSQQHILGFVTNFNDCIN